MVLRVSQSRLHTHGALGGVGQAGDHAEGSVRAEDGGAVILVHEQVEGRVAAVMEVMVSHTAWVRAAQRVLLCGTKA